MTRRAVLVGLWAYQHLLSRYTVSCPGFTSCSDWAIGAVRVHGARRGLELAVTHIENCR